MVGAEDVLAFGGDRAVHLARLLPAAETPQAQARVVPPGQRGERSAARGRAAVCGTGAVGAAGDRPGGPVAGEAGRRVRAARRRARRRSPCGRWSCPGSRTAAGVRGRPARGAGAGAGGATTVGTYSGVRAGRALIRRRSSRRRAGVPPGVLASRSRTTRSRNSGSLGAVAARRLGRGVAVPDEHRPGVVEVERRYPGGDFVEHAAEGVQVAALVDLAAADLLRRHVVRGAHGDAGAGEPGGEADVVAEAGDAEVADLHRAVGQAA